MALQTIDPSQAVITSVGGAVSGGTASSAQPVITGKADAGDIVKVYDGVKLLGSATVGADGTWSFATTATLKGGTHNFIAIAADTAGNIGASSVPLTVSIATTVVAPAAPVITALTDNVGTITGPIKNGTVTDDTRPVLTGTGVAGNVVIVYDGSKPIGSTTVGADGKWSVQPATPLTDGAHDIYATQTNSAGASGPSTDISFKVDTTTPATPVPVVTNDTTGQPIVPGTPTNDATPDISGKGTPGDTITVYDNDTPIGSLIIPSNGDWSFTPSPKLPDGPNAIVVIETNPAGTPSTPSVPINVNVDTTVPPKPALPVMTDDSGHVIPSGSTTSDAHPIISGEGTPGHTVTVFDGDTPIGTAIVQPDGEWSFKPTTDLSNGTHPITVTDTNPAGTSSEHSDPDSLVINSVAPSAPIITSLVDAVGAITGPITNNMTTDDPKPTLNGKGVAGDVITVYDGAIVLGTLTVPAGGVWKFTPTTALLDGPHDIYATETNSKGTSGHSTDISFTVDTTVPSAPVITNATDWLGDNPIVPSIPIGGIVPSPDVVINGKAVGGSVVYVYDGIILIGSAVAAGNGKWSFENPSFAEGLHDISATQKNAAGTESAHSNHWTFAIDSSVPAKPATPILTDDGGLSIPAGSTTTDGHPNISGTGKAGDIITVYDGATPIGSAKIGDDGKWTFKPATDMSGGAHSISVTDTNAAGTTGPHSDSVPFTFGAISIPTESVTITTITDHTTGGNVPSGASISDPLPSLLGYVSPALAAGETIFVYLDGAKVGSVVMNGQYWTFQQTVPIGMGSHAYQARVENSAGSSAFSAPYSFNEVALAPATPPAPTLTNDSGAAIPAGSTTSDAHPHINGKGTAGDTITVYDNGKAIGTAIVAQNGTWTFTPTSDMTPGGHVFAVTDTNPAGTASNMSPSTSVTIDTSTPAKPPVPVLTDDSGASIPAGSTTTDGHPHISGAGTAGDIITVYDGATAIGSAKIGTDGKWTFTPTSDLSSGAHSITVTDTNAAGTTGPKSDPAAFTFTVSPVAPTETTTITSLNDHTSGANIPAGGSTSDTSPVLHGTISSPLLAGEQVIIWRDGANKGAATVNGTSWTFQDSGLAVGSHTYQARVEGNGGAGPTSNTVIINEVSPGPVLPLETVSITGLWDHNLNSAIPAGSSTKDTTPSPMGTLSSALLTGETLAVYRDGQKVGNAKITGLTWSFDDSNVGVGSHSYYAQVENSAGAGPRSTTFTFTEASSVPVAPLETVAITGLTDHTSGANIPAGGSTSDTSPVVHGSVSSSLLGGESITVYRDGMTLGTATVSGTSWTFNDSNVGAGSHTYYAKVRNAAGDGQLSSPYSFTEASPAPVVPTETVSIASLTDHTTGANIPAGGSTYDSSPVVHGTVSSPLLAGETLVVYRDGVQLSGTGTMVGNTWSYNDSGVAPGTHTYTAKVVNSAGMSLPSAAYSFYEASTGHGGTVRFENMLVNGNNGYMMTFDFTGIAVPQLGYLFMDCSGAAKNNNNTTWAVSQGSGTILTVYNLGYITGGIYNFYWSLTDLFGGPNSTLIYSTTDAQMRAMANSNAYGTLSNVSAITSGTTIKAIASMDLNADHSGDASSLASTDATDHSVQASNVAIDPSSSATSQHTVVEDHQAFKGISGHDTVDLNVDPTVYFKETTAHIEGSTVHPVDATSAAPAVNTLHLTGDHQVLDLTSLTGQTAAAKISGIEVIDLGGQHNTLKLSLVDVLNLGETDLFQKDGNKQMMVNGKEGDEVDLSNSHVAGLADGEWQAHGTADVGGVTYNVYEHAGAHTELLVQQGVQVVVH
ncbi:Ig-like domain-containing protein [Burkholderia sp. S171]|uniref:Ig-like domain-containing protein n=1 Tax=Burkholderia sp. S171 TaxID=1641860 RepID=UPI00131E8881|nr:Ig-like domain-containing protein [Burkholderia sp. S171]